MIQQGLSEEQKKEDENIRIERYSSKVRKIYSSIIVLSFLPYSILCYLVFIFGAVCCGASPVNGTFTAAGFGLMLLGILGSIAYIYIAIELSQKLSESPVKISLIGLAIMAITYTICTYYVIGL